MNVRGSDAAAGLRIRKPQTIIGSRITPRTPAQDYAPVRAFIAADHEQNCLHAAQSSWYTSRKKIGLAGDAFEPELAPLLPHDGPNFVELFRIAVVPTSSVRPEERAALTTDPAIRPWCVVGILYN